MSRKIGGKGGLPEPQSVSITLRRYWYETISRKEAIRRLQTRNLQLKTRTEIEKEIPDETLHIITFQNGAFREYARFGTEVANLLLLLPAEKKGNIFEVIVPIHDSERYDDGRVKHFRGVDVHEFREAGARLLENGLHRDTFKLSKQPLTLNVDVAFLMAGHPGGSRCCRACEWVHSVLDIHCADWLCCLGTCD